MTPERSLLIELEVCNDTLDKDNVKRCPSVFYVKK